MKNHWQKYVFFILAINFIAYTFHIYSSVNFHYLTTYNQSTAKQGELVWQKYNCQSCHQMYGLGGYLGPDLTNVISTKGKDENYILAIIKTGSVQMPSFNLSDDEKSQLIEFLKSTDASGISDPRSFTANGSGMISKDGDGE